MAPQRKPSAFLQPGSFLPSLLLVASLLMRLIVEIMGVRGLCLRQRYSEVHGVLQTQANKSNLTQLSKPHV